MYFIEMISHENNLIVHYVMAEIPYLTGFSPTRWKSALSYSRSQKKSPNDRPPTKHFRQFLEVAH